MGNDCLHSLFGMMKTYWKWILTMGAQGLPQWLSAECKESAFNAEDTGSIPGFRRSPAGENGNPLQDSCQENPRNKGACRATVHGGHKQLDTTEHP